MSELPKIVPLRQSDDSIASRMPRRVALQTLLGGVGVGVTLPSTPSAQHPMQVHLTRPGTIEHAQQKASGTNYAPEFLDDHQSKTLEALAEAIVPGSTGAKVMPFLDQLLAVESAANQRDFLGALGAFDMAAITQHGKAWIAITSAEQDAILHEASSADAKTSAVRGHFENLKQWIAGAFYSSEQGMRELGWTGNVVHGELPGCSHPDGHQA